MENLSSISDLTNKESIKYLKFFQLIQSIGLFIVPPFIFGFFCYPSVKEFLRINKAISLKVLFLSIMAGVSFLPFSNLLAFINSYLKLPSFLSSIEQWMRSSENYAAKITDAFLNVTDYSGLIYNILLIAIIPAIGEELLFRGVLQKLFIDWSKSKHWGIWIAAIIFSAIHLQFFGFLPRLFLGLFFGYLLEFTGSLWYPIIAHFINNFSGVMLSYFITNSTISEKTNNFGMTSDTWVFGVIGGIIGILVFTLIVVKRNRVL